MNNVFEQKKFLGKNFFSGPPGPPTEKIFGPGPGRPGRVRGQPKGGQSRSGGVSDPSKTVKTPHGPCERWGRPARNSSSSQSYDQNTFFGLPWGLWAVFGAGWARDPVVGLETRKIPQNLKMRKKCVKRVLTQIFFQASQAP